MDSSNSFDIYTADKFYEFCTSDDSEKIFVVHQNIRSFNANYDYFSAFLDSLHLRPSIIILTETWHSDSSCSEIEGYNGYHVHRDGRVGGGVSVYVDGRFGSSMMSELSFCRNAIEICSVKVNINRDYVVNIIGLYRPPQGDTGNFFTILFEDVLPQINPGTPSIVSGDLNVDILTPDFTAQELIHNFSSFSFVPLINGITRPTDNGGSCIDHIYSNLTIDTVSGIFDSLITDHFPVFTVFCAPSNMPCIRKKFRDHSQGCLKRLKREVKVVFEYLGDLLYTDVSSSVDIVEKCLYSLYDSCCPERRKIVSVKCLSKPWLNNELLLDINRKHSLFRDYKRGIVSYDDYRSFKNRVKRKLTRVKLNYFKEKFLSGDSKVVWRNINSLTGRNRRDKFSGPPLEAFADENISSDDALCQRFNEFFATVGANLSDSVAGDESNATVYMNDRIPVTFFMRPCDAGEVERKLTSLSNSSSDSVPIFIYKYLKSEISTVISRLFNLSVVEGEFPSCLKTARVVPVYKSGSASLISNYRPISILSVMSKVFEKLMYDRLICFLDNNDVLTTNQFGFRKHHSTSDAILQFLNDAYLSLENNSHFVTVCLDLSKAFDTVSHNILLQKLSLVGVRGLSSQWFTSYLSNRLQYVRIRGTESGLRPITAGVPQGSVLGPLLFLLYINEMSNVCPGLNCLHYADDTTIYASGPDINLVSMRLQNGMVRLDDWMRNNKLVLNVQKTNCMLISNSVSRDLFPPISIRDCDIGKVTCVKFLGVLIDCNLNFNEHVDMVCGRVSRAIGAVRRIRCYITDNVLTTLYYSLIYSHLTYGILSWGNSSEGNINRIERLRLRYVRLYNVDGGDQVNQQTLLDFRKIFIYFAIVKLVQSYKFCRHDYFGDLLSGLVPLHNHNTRFVQRDNLNLPLVRLRKTQRSFLPTAIAAWNSLPAAIREENSLFQLKRKLRLYLRE